MNFDRFAKQTVAPTSNIHYDTFFEQCEVSDLVDALQSTERLDARRRYSQLGVDDFCLLTLSTSTTKHHIERFRSEFLKRMFVLVVEVERDSQAHFSQRETFKN